MKTFYYILIAFVLFVACSKEYANERIISGDWEVVEVTVDGVNQMSRFDSLGISKYSFTYILNTDSGFMFTSGNHLIGADWLFITNEAAIRITNIEMGPDIDIRPLNVVTPGFVDSLEIVSIDSNEVQGTIDTTYLGQESWLVSFEGKKTMILSHNYLDKTYMVKMEKIKDFSIDRRE